MLAKLLSSVALKLLTEKVIIKVSVSLLGYLTSKTENNLDDELFKTIKEALGE